MNQAIGCGIVLLSIRRCRLHIVRLLIGHVIGIVCKISGRRGCGAGRLSTPDFSLTCCIWVYRLRETRRGSRKGSTLVGGKVSVVETKVEVKTVWRFVLAHCVRRFSFHLLEYWKGQIGKARLSTCSEYEAQTVEVLNKGFHQTHKYCVSSEDGSAIHTCHVQPRGSSEKKQMARSLLEGGQGLESFSKRKEG